MADDARLGLRERQARGHGRDDADGACSGAGRGPDGAGAGDREISITDEARAGNMPLQVGAMAAVVIGEIVTAVAYDPLPIVQVLGQRVGVNERREHRLWRGGDYHTAYAAFARR